MLNHFNFKYFANDKILVTNDFGRYAFLSQAEFLQLVTDTTKTDTNLERSLASKLFIMQPLDIYAQATTDNLRGMKNYLFRSTSLHIFVVTNMCNLRCIYCQAQDKAALVKGLMPLDIGKRAVDIALQAPSQHLTFEFQGGEPLLNFPVIKGLIEYTEERCAGKSVDFTLVSNLTVLTKEILDFLLAHKVSICTSLDGPEDLHNNNRHCPHGGNSFQQMLAGLQLIKTRSCKVGAIQTTTRASLARAKDIVNCYYKMGLPGIFLRPLTPLGFAKNDWERIGYTPEEFLAFYREAFAEIIHLNKNGKKFTEQHAVFFLRKILRHDAYNYMELRSPCGAAVGQLAYYYNGEIYSCDEARMVAEAGDKAFRLGDVHTDNFASLLANRTCKATCAASILETIPGCCDCVYQPYCGVCPVVNYASEKDIFPKQLGGYKCAVYRGILDFLFEQLAEGGTEIRDIFNTWVEDEHDENIKGY